jgi:ArsR family transcriptional regulator, arsenate/arsenite/antimonite-responsive transcriptional repressor
LESERCGKWTYFRIHPKHVPLISFLITNTPQAAHHKVDAKHATSRLKDRENSCCPGPQKLAKP